MRYQKERKHTLSLFVTHESNRSSSKGRPTSYPDQTHSPRSFPSFLRCTFHNKTFIPVHDSIAVVQYHVRQPHGTRERNGQTLPKPGTSSEHRQPPIDSNRNETHQRHGFHRRGDGGAAAQGLLEILDRAESVADALLGGCFVGPNVRRNLMSEDGTKDFVYWIIEVGTKVF